MTIGALIDTLIESVRQVYRRAEEDAVGKEAAVPKTHRHRLIGASTAERLYQQRMLKKAVKLRHKRWLGWFQKRANLISIVSVSVALTVNALKDKASDALKDHLAILKDIKAQYVKTHDVVTLQENFNTVEQLLLDLSTKDDEEKIRDSVNAHYRRLEGAGMTLSNLSSALPKLPERTQKELASMEGDYTSAEKSFSDVMKSDKRGGEAWFDRINSLDHDLSRLEVKVTITIDNLEDELLARMRSAQDQLDNWNAWNFWVFPLGILLAVLGQVIKQKSSND